MDILTIILLIGAFICFLLATVGIGQPRINLVAFGLALYMLTLLIGRR